MEYSLLKTITPELAYLRPIHPYVKLSSTPAKDYVNPGLAQTTRLYSFYVPLYSNFNPFEIKKSDTKDIKQQEGFGEVNDPVENSSIDTTDNTKEPSLNDSQIDKPIISNNNEITEGLKESLNFPKINVKKTIFKSKNTLPKNEKKLKHKFQII